MSFYHPEYLYFLSALLIPLIIHLFNFKRFRKVYFTNIAFLKDVQQQSKRHSQWRHLIIMLLRMLIIASIVFAFASPYISKNAKLHKETDVSNINIFLDNSFSMEARGEDGSLFDEARVIAREIALSQKNTDKFRLLTNNKYTFSRSYVSKDVFLDQLEKAGISNSSLNFNNIPSLLDNSDAKITETYLISDFQSKQSKFDTWKSDSLNTIYLIPIKAREQGNVFVDSVWIETPILQPKQNINLHFRIHNQSNQEVRDLPISLNISNKQKAVLSHNIAEKSFVESEINFRIDSSGFFAGSIEIQDYPIVYDDVFNFSLNIENSTNILIISSQEANTDLETYIKSDSSFVSNFMSEDQIDYSVFFNYPTIVLNSVSHYSSGLLSELNKFINRGGNLIIIPSISSSIDELNNCYNSLGLQEIIGIDTFKRNIAEFDLLSREFKGIFESDVSKEAINENTDLPYFRRKLLLKNSNYISSKVLLKDDVGDASLVKYYVSSGSIFVLYFPIDRKYSNFTAHSVFVPIMFNLLRSQQSTQGLYYTLQSDKYLNLNSSIKNESRGFRMVKLQDSVEFIPQIFFKQNQIQISFQQRPQEAGVYNLISNNELIAMPAFNYNRDESYLSYYNRSDLNNIISRGGLKNVSILAARKGAMDTLVSEAKKGIQLWKLFIILAISFLIIELLLLRFSK
jgi:hypothetical protein